MAYTSRDTVKEWLSIPDATDSEDSAIDDAIAAAEARIDQWAGRTFVVPSAVSTRDVAPWSDRLVVLPADVAQITDMVVKEDTTGDGVFDATLAAGDWYLGPGDEAPFTRLVRTSGRWHVSRYSQRTVHVEAWFGYAMAVPDPIVQAATMLAGRLYQRRSSPLGFQTGLSPDMGEVRVSRIDHDVASLLAGYRVPAVA